LVIYKHFNHYLDLSRYIIPQQDFNVNGARVSFKYNGDRIYLTASSDRDTEPDVVMACCGDTPTLEILAAVSILREHLPDLSGTLVKADYKCFVLECDRRDRALYSPNTRPNHTTASCRYN